MKRTLVFLIVILIASQLHSQTNLEIRYTAPTLCLKMGLNHSTFRYSDPNLESLPHNLFVNPNIGACLELYINNNIFVAPELFLYNRGHLSQYIYEDNFNVTYKVQSRYITARIPIYYRFRNKHYNKNFNPFLVISPSYNYLLGGHIYLYQPKLSVSEVSIDIGSANMRQQDFSVFFGGGCQFYINYGDFSIVTKIELGYNIGLTNSFSDSEIYETSHGENTNAYNITGERKINNIEFNVTIGVPLKFSHCDACWGSNRNVTSKKNNKRYHSPLR